MKLQGLDHIDVRVRSLREVEAFYDALLPALGLSRKSEGHVADDGEWYGVGNDRSRNAIEYATPVVPGMRGWFIGFIEEPSTVANGTRIAFAIEDKGALPMIEPLVRQAGGRVVEWSSEENYPALFFEDPSGTRLEICARLPASRD